MGRMLTLRTVLFQIVLLVVWSQGYAGQGTISYFRSDGGVADDVGGVPDRCDPEKYLLWRQPLPRGNSTPCVHGDRIFVTTHADKTLATVALDRQTGKQLWKKIAPVDELEKFHVTGSPASCTPACDGDRLYVFFGSHGLLCYSLDGKWLWTWKMGSFQDEFGASSSPVLVDGKVILNHDHDVGSFIIALDQKTGDVVWRTEREGFTRSYSTPVVIEVDGKPQVVVAGPLQLVAYDVKDGSRLWWVDGLSRIVSPTPFVGRNMLYVACWTPGGDAGSRIAMEPWLEAAKQWDGNGDGRIVKDELSKGPVLQRFYRIDLDQDGGLNEEEWKKYAAVFERAQNVVFAIRPGGSGDITKKVAWKYHRGLPSVPSPLVYRDVVYMVKDSGIVTSLEASSGKVLKRGRARGGGNYYASPVAADGKVFLASERGVVTVLEAVGEWEILSSHDFGERIMATPIIAHGKIYLRTDEALYCLGKN